MEMLSGLNLGEEGMHGAGGDGDIMAEILKAFGNNK